MDLDDFESNKKEIRKILKKLSADYILFDIGFTKRTYKNWATDHKGNPIIIDHGYIEPITEDTSFKCRNLVLKNHKNNKVKQCNGNLSYNKDFTKVKCDKCGEVFNNDVLFRVRLDEIKAMEKANGYDNTSGFTKSEWLDMVERSDKIQKERKQQERDAFIENYYKEKEKKTEKENTKMSRREARRKNKQKGKDRSESTEILDLLADKYQKENEDFNDGELSDYEEENLLGIEFSEEEFLNDDDIDLENMASEHSDIIGNQVTFIPDEESELEYDSHEMPITGKKEFEVPNSNPLDMLGGDYAGDELEEEEESLEDLIQYIIKDTVAQTKDELTEKFNKMMDDKLSNITELLSNITNSKQSNDFDELDSNNEFEDINIKLTDIEDVIREYFTQEKVTPDVTTEVVKLDIIDTKINTLTKLMKESNLDENTINIYNKMIKFLDKPKDIMLILDRLIDSFDSKLLYLNLKDTEFMSIYLTIDGKTDVELPIEVIRKAVSTVEVADDNLIHISSITAVDVDEEGKLINSSSRLIHSDFFLDSNENKIISINKDTSEIIEQDEE